jgi:hypothetical protein
MSDTSPHQKIEGSAEVALTLGKNADRAKQTGHVFLFITLLVGASILFLFLQAANIEAYLDTAPFRALTEKVSTGLKNDELSGIELGLQEIERVAGNNEDLKRDLRSMLIANFGKQPSPATPLDETLRIIGSSVVRIGTVLIAIFIIQIMVGFVRYYYKLSEHLRTCSLALQLSRGHITNLEILVPLLMPSGLDFGKMPNSPFEKLADSTIKTLGEISKKIPSP